ncbi:MAG TPA: proton-conducting transporter membrane subunit, partial [Micavibrio sp.]
QGIEGGIFQMISHGIVSGALFLCVGVVYDRLHTREISRYGGIVKNMPKYATVFMLMMLASVGLPGTSGFVGEFLVLLGAYQADTWVALFAATGLILGAAYMLVLYRGVVFGPQENDDAAAMPDLEKREFLIFVPFVVMVLWLGVAPAYVMDRVAPSAAQLLTNYKTHLQNAATAEAAAAEADEAGGEGVATPDAEGRADVPVDEIEIEMKKSAPENKTNE